MDHNQERDMRNVSAALLVMTCIGCVTPYQRMGLTGGFRDAEVSPGVYEILVSGNGVTGIDTLTEYFHRRAKELCEEKGKPFYDFEMRTGQVRWPGTSHIRPSWGGGVDVTTTPGVAQGRVYGLVTCTDTDPRPKGQAPKDPSGVTL